ncbi:MAG: cysteine peptidase family C39 domain-containing protein [Melioribacteraceae bacterium]|nr:cysteine peptidase family C39 domain-containing protein [Melioribacteraceae bacterium]
MIQTIVNKVARSLQSFEEAHYPNSVILNMGRSLQLNYYSCGLQSAFVILEYFERVNSVDEIDYDLDLLSVEGIDIKPLLKIFKNHGLKVKVNEDADPDDIKEALIEGKPVLVSVDDGEHWVVVYGFSEDRIFVLDPSIYSSIRCSWSYEDFLNRWDDNWIAVVSNN